MKPEEQTVVVQGFGNVGSYYALFMQQEGAKVIAISDSGGGVYNPKGIDIPSAIAHKQERGTLQGPRRRRADLERGLLLLECDILAPCGLEQVITEENADRIKAKIICEGANGPTTPAADEILEDQRRPRPARRARERGRRRRLLLRVGAGPPGVLLEGGRGQRQAQGDRRQGVRGDLAASTKARDVSMRMAAYGLAVQRVAEATMTRGLYP